ncbi:MAG: hypothetical protein JSS93_00480 [Bacteroidetes bacterium]|nr:hypothetical protein [Bacteroidota bacterium]
MKKIYNPILLSFFAMILTMACRDESKIIYDTAKLPSGVYARMLAVPPGTAVISSFDATNFPFQVEVVGVGVNSNAIKQLTINVRYLNDTSGVVKPVVSLGSVTGFTVNQQTQLPNATLSITGAALRTALGLAPTDLKLNYQFDFTTQLVLNDGRVFSAANFDPNMSNSFYLAAYEYFTVLKLVP